MRTRSRHRIPPCPNCGANDVVPIRYGLPTAEGREEIERGKVIAGGCIVERDSPKWYCKACGHDFGNVL